jgi:DNA-binding CsgD family transcriptional regulator
MATAVHPVAAYAPPLFERSPPAWPGLATGVLDLLREAVLVIARDFRLLGLNRAARALLREGDGLALSPGGLVAATPAATCELHRGIERASQGEVSRVQLPRLGRAALSLLVEPHPLGAAGVGAAVIFAVDPSGRRLPSGAELVVRYGLTRCESDVAQRLAAGADLEKIAAEFGITLHTVRGHLKQVYAKTRVHRQAELVAKLLSDV